VLDAHGEAALLALACAKPAVERTAWSMHLLADKLVQRGVVGGSLDETLQPVLNEALAPHE
jgi:hypothetical protein